MKLTKKITLLLILAFSLSLTSSALAVNNFSFHTTSVDFDGQRDRSYNQGGGRNGGGDSRGSRDSGRDSSRDNRDSRGNRDSRDSRGSRDNRDSRDSRDSERHSSRSRDGEKQPLVIKRAEKGRDRRNDSD